MLPSVEIPARSMFLGKNAAVESSGLSVSLVIVLV